MIHRYPAYSFTELVCGPIVAVWPNGRIVRVVSEKEIGKAYVEGVLTSGQLESVLKFIEANDGLLGLDDHPIVMHAAWEQTGIRLKGYLIEYGETAVGEWGRAEHDADVAALRSYLMSLVIRESRFVQSPWTSPPRDWYR